ncbi:hypothetical protein Patl1_17445 [Pistacia atlantica]|uniref:Uncharacterized protein n=1 Tax=Pistacia atlantica TaxID=434234 RepID=A0ACC1C0Z4_9ROSI|nr:hypothetical protein Patl1_17445 [Pistacia atlantica]
MGRAPCCSKVGLRTGPWSPKEDSVLTNYIRANGDGDWRNLPKKAVTVRNIGLDNKASGLSSSGHEEEGNNIVRPNNTEEVPWNIHSPLWPDLFQEEAVNYEGCSLDNACDISFLDSVPIEDNMLDKVVEEYQQLLNVDDSVQFDSFFSV